MMTLKFRSVAALLLGGLLAAGGAQATTFSPLTLVQQAKKADVIVQATIGVPTSVTENNQVYAVYPLKVSETLAGDAATLPQTVGSQGGGGPAVFVLSGVESAPVFQMGQEVVLLLYTGRLDSPLVGYNQGAYLVSNGQVSVLNAPLTSVPGAGAFVQQSAAQNPVAQASAAQSAVTPASLDPVLPVATGTPVPLPATPGTPVGPAPTPLSADLVPEPPIPVFTTAEFPEAQPLSPLPPVAGSSVALTAPPTAPVVVAPGMSAPSVSVPAPVPVLAPGVLGTIRTAAELKAAIVAARAGK